MTPHEQLPASYLASCEKFFKSIKPQAASNKRQAPEASSNKPLTKQHYKII
jgi:hypothetical protein